MPDRTLLHSLMRVPELVPRVWDVAARDPDGFTATVHSGAHILCTITDNGHDPLYVSGAPAGVEAVRDYIRECRTPLGQAPTEAEWCEALVEEHEGGHHVEHLAEDEHAVRWFDEDGERYLKSITAPAAASDYRIVSTARANLPSWVDRADAWLPPHGWVTLVDSEGPCHVEGVTLPHTGLYLPTDRVSLRDVQRVELRHTTAAKANVYLGETMVGTVEQSPCDECKHTDDIGTTLYRTDGFPLEDEWDAVVVPSRDRHSIPVDEDTLAWLLLEEHAYEAAIARCETTPGRFLHRLTDSDGRRRRYAHTDTGLADAGAALERAPHLRRPAQTVRAELWAGPERDWVTYYDA
jgi:hypothetical protein